MTQLIFRTAIALIFTVLLTSSAAAQSQEDRLACRQPPPPPCKGCSPYVAEKIRQKDIKSMKEAEQSCLEQKRKETQRIEERKAAEEGRCGILARPEIQKFAVTALTQTKQEIKSAPIAMSAWLIEA